MIRKRPAIPSDLSRPGPSEEGWAVVACTRLHGGVFGNGFEHFSLRGSARASEGWRSQASA